MLKLCIEFIKAFYFTRMQANNNNEEVRNSAAVSIEDSTKMLSKLNPAAKPFPAELGHARVKITPEMEPARVTAGKKPQLETAKIAVGATVADSNDRNAEISSIDQVNVKGLKNSENGIEDKHIKDEDKVIRDLPDSPMCLPTSAAANSFVQVDWLWAEGQESGCVITKQELIDYSDLIATPILSSRTNLSLPDLFPRYPMPMSIPKAIPMGRLIRRIRRR